KRGAASLPPHAACVNGHVSDFNDVACDLFGDYIEQLFADGITAGCGQGNYCPGSFVTRAQMAVFLERAKRGAASPPPHATCINGHVASFNDVACDVFGDYIEQLFADRITAGCGQGSYCPSQEVT